jgi:hypothetical protein
VQREPQDTREIGDRFTNLENGLNLKFKKINQIKDYFFIKNCSQSSKSSDGFKSHLILNKLDV